MSILCPSGAVHFYELGGKSMTEKEIKAVKVAVNVDTTDLKKAIKKTKHLIKLLKKAKSLKK